MKKYIHAILLISILYPGLLWAACGGTSPNLVAASASRDEVMDCISKAARGDTVNVPAGTESWAAESQGCTANTMLCMKKGIKLQGAGAGSTIITLTGTATNGAVCYEADADSISNNQPFEISGFTFDGGGVDYAEGLLNIKNSSTTTVLSNIKIHHNKFQNDNGNGTAISMNGPLYGVAYLNTFDKIAFSIRSFGYDDNAWDIIPREYGTANNFYFEDNTIQASSSGNSGFYMVGQGGGIVYRYNSHDQTNSTGQQFGDHHGLQSMETSEGGECQSNPATCDPTRRSCDQWSHIKSENYGNLFTNVEANILEWATLRGSWTLMFNNLMNSGIGDRRPEYSQYSCDTCISEVDRESTDSMHIQNTYVWNNIAGSTVMNLTKNLDMCEGSPGSPYTITADIDYFNYDATFDGTSGVGCGTLASRPACASGCTLGVGYWATTQSCDTITPMVGVSPSTPISGTLYKLTGAGTWTQIFTPYQYPHPLRGLGAVHSFGSGSTTSWGSGATHTFQ